MIKDINNIYRNLHGGTKLIFRICMITFVVTVISAIYTHTLTHMNNYYNLLILSEDLLNVARSVIGIGALGVLISEILEKYNK